MPKVFQGMLEVDHERGVIYFHLKDLPKINQYKTVTLLRIGNLPKPIPDEPMDIIHMHGCNWQVKE